MDEPFDPTDDERALLALLADEPMPDEWADTPAEYTTLLDEMDRAMRWHRAATLHRDRVARPFDREMQRLTAARDEAVGPRDRDVSRVKQRLADLHAALIRLDPRAITVKLPHGTAWSKKAGGKLEVVDEAKALAWAATNAPDAVKLSLLVSALPDGVTIPGTVVTPEGRNYGVRP